MFRPLRFGHADYPIYHRRQPGEPSGDPARRVTYFEPLLPRGFSVLG